MIAQKTTNVKRFHSFLLRAGLSLLLGAAFMPSSFATHIVGGQIGYRWISGNTYEVILDVYRDCSNPINEPFDPTAYVGIYNLQGTWIQNLSLPFMGADTLDAILFDDCLFVPDFVCVARTQYRGLVTLNPNPTGGGYRFSYVRCCRNETITNIEDPLNTGAVYDIVLTTAAIQRRNSSPQFRSWPPVFICVNNPIMYDHSALDTFETTGLRDSIVYRLCEPLSGGSRTRPRPIPPQNPPPFDTVVWLGPTYSLFNMLGNTGDTTLILSGCTTSDTIVSDSLRIDPVTGLLTGTPTMQGQFVVGVCAEEYDRATGELLTTTRRDFQYNVGFCSEVLAHFDAPTVQCDSLTVQYTNTSTNADEFIWYFDYPSPTPSSTEENPIFTFPDTGTYIVALVAEPLSVCIDTFCQSIYLATSTLLIDARADVFDCDDFSVLRLQDLSTDSAVLILNRLWTVTYDDVTLTSSEQNPIFNIPLGVSGTARLTVTNANTCVESVDIPFTSGLDNPGGLIEAELSACNGDTLNLNPNTDPGIGFSYFWEPATGLIDPQNSVNPRSIASGPAVYTVTITAPDSICQIVKTVTVSSAPLPNLSFEAVADCDGLTINFNNTSTGATAFEWNFGDPLNPGAGSTDVNPSYTYPDVGTYLVTLKVPEGLPCRDSIFQEVTVLMKALSAEFEVEYESCSPDSVTVRFLDRSISTASPVVAWSWDFGNGQTSNQQNPEITLFANTDLEVSFTVTAADNCSNTMTKPVSIRLVDALDFEAVPASIVRCLDGTAQLPAPLSVDYIYRWSPEDGINDPSSNNPVFSPAQTTTYTLTIGAVGIDTCFYDLDLTVIVPPAIGLIVDGDGLSCEPEATLTAMAQVPADFEWTDAMGTVLSTTNTLTIPVSGPAIYTVEATDAFGCTENIEVEVTGGPVNVTLPSVVAVCLGEALELSVVNNDPNQVLSYTWSPASFFVPGTENAPVPDYIETPGERLVTVNILNQYGCPFTGTIQTAVIDTAFQLGFTTMLQCNGATVEFTNTSTNAFAFVWNFGDGTTSTEENPVHTYNTAGSYTVTLTIGYAVSCNDTISVVVDVVDPQIIAGFTYDIVECTNGSAQVAFFDASINSFNNTNQWTWVFSNGQSSDQQNPVITVDESGDLIVTLTINTENDCPATVTDTVNIQLVNVSIADSLLVCPGESAPLNPGGNPAYTYLWTPATGLSDPTAANPIASPSQTTVYSVQVQALGADTCSYMQEVVVFVPDPIALSIPADTTTCGGVVELAAITSAPATVIWTDGMGQPLGGPTVEVDPFRVETFTATATDQYGCTETASVTITDRGVDVTVTPSGNITACEDVEFQITTVNLDDEDMLLFDWNPDSLIVSGDGTATPIVRVGLEGAMITGVISNQFGCADTVQVNVTIVPFKIELADTTFICFGEPAGISPGLNPNFQYEWSPTTDLDLSDPSNPVYIGTTGGVYSVTVTDNTSGFLCQTERTVTVFVTPAMELTATGDTTVCQLGDVTLNASAGVQATFSWSVPGQAPFATGSPATFTAAQAGTYQVQVIATDGFACQDSAIVNILATDFQPGPLGSPQTVCGNTPTALNPGGNPAYIYTWSPTADLDLSDPSNPLVIVSEPATYNVTVTDPASGCSAEGQIQVGVFPLINLTAAPDTVLCEIAPVTLTASGSGNVTYSWFLNNFGNPAGTGSSITVTPAEGSNTYFVIAEDPNGCKDTTSVNVSTFLISTGIQETVQVCIDTPTPINPGGNPDYVYVWSPTTGLDLSNPHNPVITTDVNRSYTVTISDPVLGCSIDRQVNVLVYPAIELVTDATVPVCEPGAEATLRVSSTVPADLEWADNPAFTPVAGTGVSITVTPPAGASTWYVRATDDNGCTETQSITVNNFPISASITPPVVLCVPETTTQLGVTNLDPTQTLSYDWTPANAVTPPTGNPVVTVNASQAQNFSVIVTNQFGCADTLSTTVTILDLPGTVTLVVDPEEIIIGESSDLEVLGCDGCTYQWSPAETLDDDDIRDPVATPEQTTEYTVVVSKDGCSVTLRGTVTVNFLCEEPYIFFPSAFTPNGDGQNDVLRLRARPALVLDAYWVIYNRWGQQMFEANNLNDQWDGTYKGKDLPPDVYGYYLRVNCPGGEQFTKKGNVTLLR